MRTAKNSRNSGLPEFHPELLIIHYLSDKPLPSGRVRDELVRQSIRTLGKDNGQKVNFGKAEREAGLGREHIARFHPLRSISSHWPNQRFGCSLNRGCEWTPNCENAKHEAIRAYRSVPELFIINYSSLSLSASGPARESAKTYPR